MKTVVAGSRTILDYEIVAKAIKDSGFIITEVVSGGAVGPDSLGARWAWENKVPVKYFRPDWKQYGKQAGFLRNFEMAAYADAAIIIWDGRSGGTQDMIRRAKGCQCKLFIATVPQTQITDDK